LQNQENLIDLVFTTSKFFILIFEHIELIRIIVCNSKLPKQIESRHCSVSN